MPWNITLFDSTGKIKDARNMTAVPPGYTDFISNWTDMAKDSADNFAAGGTDWEAAEYQENGSRTVFYSAYDNLWRHTAWATRTGNTVDDLQAGMDRALAVQLERWGVGPTSTWHRAADVAYYGVQNGDGADVTAVEQDIIDHVEGQFTFSRLNEYHVGTAEDSTNNFYGRYTARSRPAALLAKALIYYEQQGLGRYEDPQQGTDTIELAYDMMINHLYRWRNEFLNQPAAGDPGDDTAVFMMFLTIDALRLCREWFIDQSESVDQFFPANVITGNFGSESSTSNPWSTTVEAITDVLDWLGGPIDGHTPDTDAYPKAADYCRVTLAHTAGTDGGEAGGPRAVGDPMIQVGNDTEGDYVISYYRSSDAYISRNIQMMNATNYWWMASVLDGIDNATRDKYITWGDKFFYGAVLRYSAGYQQKTRNQNMYAIYEGLEYRNAVTGRND